MTIPIEKLIKEISSYYRLVLIASQRANELISGAQPLVMPVSKKATINALQEIARGKIHVGAKIEKADKSKASG